MGTFAGISLQPVARSFAMKIFTRGATNSVTQPKIESAAEKALSRNPTPISCLDMLAGARGLYKRLGPLSRNQLI